LEKTPPRILDQKEFPADLDFNAGTVILIAKPAGMSSFGVVSRVRRICRVRKAGHAGTLDPAATGLLLVLTGGATRLQNRFMTLEKEYLATILLGSVTDTDDLEGRVIQERSWASVEREKVAALLSAEFLGEHLQTPPRYSALKIAGKPAYRRMRRGEEVTPQPRPVKLHQFEIEAWHPPEITLRLRCSSGFYVRSLARELGEKLGCGGTLKSLCRTRIGSYRLEQALSLEELEARLSQ
jgi:tRNA pseudouridine55 synthase